MMEFENSLIKTFVHVVQCIKLTAKRVRLFGIKHGQYTTAVKQITIFCLVEYRFVVQNLL